MRLQRSCSCTQQHSVLAHSFPPQWLIPVTAGQSLARLMAQQLREPVFAAAVTCGLAELATATVSGLRRPPLGRCILAQGVETEWRIGPSWVRFRCSPLALGTRPAWGALTAASPSYAAS